MNFDLIINKIEDLLSDSKQSKAVEAVLLTQLNQDEDKRLLYEHGLGPQTYDGKRVVLASGKWVPGTEPSQVHKPACWCMAILCLLVNGFCTACKEQNQLC